MKLVITEINLREHERWHYIVDQSIGSQIINKLITFVKLSQKVFDRERDNTMRFQAISKYTPSFYDDLILNDKGYYIGINGKHRMHFGGSQTYKNGMNFIKKIAITRLDKAINKMRKGENILYKDFEFIASKK